jgi:hypothetical protein
MAESSSIGKVVQTIMDSLSEAVSGLILLVISFQESSAPMPNHIPPAADGVASTSNTLADVATGIAEDEYGDYPDIQNPILAAAKEVRASSAALIQAVNFLKTNSDRNRGWAGLLDACRTISGDTVYILQLVYGAELQKLLLAAQQAQNLAKEVSPNTAAKNPQQFADQVGDLAGHAEGLSNFIGDKAQEEESPLAKEQQQKSAAALAKISNELPALANNVLKSPQDAKAKKTFEDKVKELEKEIEAASIPVREKLALQPTGPTPLGAPPPFRSSPHHPPPHTQSPSQPPYHSQSPNQPPHHSPPPHFSQAPSGTQQPSYDKPKNTQSPPPPEGRRAVPTHVSGPPPEPHEIPKHADKAKEALHNLSNAANARNAPSVARDAQSLVDAVNPLIDSLERLANDSADPERKKQLKQAAEDVRSQVPKALAASVAQVKDPAKNNQEPGRAAQKLEKAIEAAKSIGRPAPEIEVAAASRNVAQDIPAVVTAAEKGDPKATEEALKNLAAMAPKLDKNLKDFAEKPVHPLKKAKAAEAAKKLDSIVPEITAAARDVASKPTEKKPLERLEKAKQAAEDVLKDVANLGTELLADARKQNDDLTRLELAAHNDEPKKVSDTEKTIVKREPKVAQAARNQAAMSDNPAAKKNLTEAVEKLDKLLPEQVRAAQEVAKSGGAAEEPKKKLNKNITDTRNALADVAKAAESMPPVENVPKPAAEVLLEQIQEFMDAMASQDPNDEDSVKNLMNKFAEPLQKFLADLPEKDDDDIVVDKLADLAHDIGNELEELADAADHGKPQSEIDRLGSAISKKGKELVALAKPLIEKIAEPEDKPMLLDALDDIGALLPEMVTAAKELAKNPRDPRKKKDLDGLKDAVNKNVKFVIGKAKPPPEVAAANAARKFPKGAKRVIDALKEDDPNALLDALKNLKKTVRDMNNAPVKDEPNYLAGRNIAEAVKELEKQLANKNKKGNNEPPTKPFQEAKKAMEKALTDPKAMPKPNPTNQALADVRDANNILDRLAGLADVPNRDPKKIVDATKALNKKIEPIVKAAKVEAEKAKDPETKKKIEDAIKELEKSIPPNIQATKDLVQNPNSEPAKQAFLDSVEDIRAPLVNLYAAMTPETATPVAKAAAIARQEEAAAKKLAAAANRGDTKAAQEALKSLKDLQENYKKAAKAAAAKAPERVKADVAKSIADLDDLIKKAEPAVNNFVKNKDDPKARENVVAAAKALERPLEKAIESIESIPAATEDHAVESAKQILATIRSKTIKKVDPKYLLQVSKELAGLLSDMVTKTRDELVRDEDNLTDRAKAALDLDRLLNDLDNSSKPPQASQTQSVEDLLASLSALAGGSGAGTGSTANKQPAQPTQLTQQISGVAKEIKAKTANSGSLEGTQLHSLSQNLASDLQKFADADSGSSRSDLIVVAKSVSAHIIGLSNELLRLAKLCTDPKIQDKLYQSAQVLRNYSTQLKIMASVRAASQKTHGDSTTDQLVILAKNLSSIVGDATNAVSVMKSTKRGL